MKLIGWLASLPLALLTGCKAVNPDVATSYNNIGLVHYKKAEYDKALEYYQKSVAISYWSIGPNGRGQARSS
jgi:tetratricopeptide (TPR) repeat protein